MWKDLFRFLCSKGQDENDGEQGQGNIGKDFIFPLVLHPDTSGIAHVMGMVDRMIAWLKARGR